MIASATAAFIIKTAPRAGLRTRAIERWQFIIAGEPERMNATNVIQIDNSKQQAALLTRRRSDGNIRCEQAIQRNRRGPKKEARSDNAIFTTAAAIAHGTWRSYLQLFRKVGL